MTLRAWRVAQVTLAVFVAFGIWSLRSYLTAQQTDLKELRVALKSHVDRSEAILLEQRASLVGGAMLLQRSREGAGDSVEGARAERPALAEERRTAEPVVEPPAPPSPEVVAKVAAAKRVIDVAVKAGQWTEKNRAELSAAAESLPPDEKFALTVQVAQAVNAGLLKMDAPIPPI